MKVVLFIVLISVMICMFLFWKHRRKWKQMRAERSGESGDELLLNYAVYPQGECVARVVRDLIRRDYLKSDFPVRADDDIEETLDIAAEDFDELVESSLSKCGVSLDGALKMKDRLPICTVDDLIRLILDLKNGGSESASAQIRE